MMREEWEGNKIYPFESIKDLNVNMESWGISNYEILTTNLGYVAKSHIGGSWFIYDQDGSFRYNL